MPEKNHILVVDNDKTLRDQTVAILVREGHQVTEAVDGNQALDLLHKQGFGLIVTNLELPAGPDGLELLEHVQEHMPSTPVIMITGSSSVDMAVKAMQSGAFDLQEKPVNLDHLRLTVDRALENAFLHHAFDYLRHEQPYIYRFDKVLAKDPAMKQLIEQVKRVAPTDVTVMLTGESGTGKSLIAGTIHANSPRREQTLVTVNCAALPETLLESELFGHEKGAFTGAHKDRIGRIQQAHGGTLFLDEVGDMAPSTQAKLLRSIEEKIIQRVGGSREIRVDVRIIAATNHDLKKAVKVGGFREDLFYRLNVAPLHIPPLRERKEDVLPLAERFLQRISKELKLPSLSLGEEAQKAIVDYHWPGNIRELRNAVERAVLFAAGLEVTPADLGLAPKSEPASNPLMTDSLELEKIERWAIEMALERCDWVQSRAAVLLGITPRALVYKLKKHNIRHPRLEARRRSR